MYGWWQVGIPCGEVRVIRIGRVQNRPGADPIGSARLQAPEGPLQTQPLRSPRGLPRGAVNVLFALLVQGGCLAGRRKRTGDGTSGGSPGHPEAAAKAGQQGQHQRQHSQESTAMEPGTDELAK